MNGTKVGLKDDVVISQKLVLLQFASSQEKFVETETVGIKICGGFETEELLNSRSKDLFQKGNIYFPLEPQSMGKWISYPDYSQDTRTEVQQSEQGESLFGGKPDLNELIKNINTDESVDEMKQQEKNVIKQSTYFSEPETCKDLEHLIGLVSSFLKKRVDDYTFYKNVMTKDLNELEMFVEHVVEESEKVELTKGVNYCELLKDPECEQKWAVFTFVAPTGTMQKADTFCFKIRGVYSSETLFNERVAELQKEDPVFVICKVPVGEWLAFNFKDNSFANEDLNVVLGKRVKTKLNEKKVFDKRVSDAKNNIENFQPILKTRADITSSIDYCKENLKLIKQEFEEYHDILIYNFTKHQTDYEKPLEQEVQDFTKEVLVLAYDTLSIKNKICL